MKKGKLFILLLAAMASVGIKAAERSAAEMQQIALATLQSQNMSGDAAKSSARISLSLVENKNTYSVYANGDNGFVIVSRDDRFTPVLAYSRGKFESDRHSDGFNWWLSATVSSMEAMLASGEVALSPAKASSFSVVEPLVTTEWGQETMPYYVYTPEIGSVKCAVGCAALSIAEILNYHKYPESASFSGSYSLDGGNSFRYEPVNSTYTWNFKDRYGQFSKDGTMDDMGYASYSPSEGRAIGSLLRDCGYAVGMIYGAASAAENLSVPRGLVDCFGYATEGTNIYFKDFYSDYEWNNMVHRELASGHPVLLFGTDPNNGYGHIFVGHGWDENGLVAIEWGWMGVDNGYYAMDMLKGSKYGFTYNVGLVTAHPHKLSTDAFKSLWISEKAYQLKYNSNANTLSIVIPEGIYNFDKDTFKGQIGLILEKADNGEVGYISLTNNQDYSFDAFMGLSATSTQLTDCSFDPNAVYYVYLGTKDQRDTEWQPIRTLGGVMYYTLRTDASGNATFDDNFTIDTAIKGVHADNTANNNVRSYNVAGIQSSKGLVIIKNGQDVRKIFK